MSVKANYHLPSPPELIDYATFKETIAPDWIEMVLEKFRRGEDLSNHVFESIYPDSLLEIAAVHWTPLHVARRAVEYLVGKEGKKTRVLDVGSGIGKVCLIGALTTDSDFTGIEKREYFVRFANALLKDQSVSNARCIHGEMAALDWSSFDSFYLFNPFYENRVPTLRIDQLVCLSEGRYRQLIQVVESKLEYLRLGTRVVTYHGFGGRFPESYSLEASEFLYSGNLDLWVKRA